MGCFPWFPFETIHPKGDPLFEKPTFVGQLFVSFHLVLGEARAARAPAASNMNPHESAHPNDLQPNYYVLSAFFPTIVPFEDRGRFPGLMGKLRWPKACRPKALVKGW